MIRVLHLRPLAGDYQTDASVDALIGDPSKRTDAIVQTIGRGGTYSMISSAIIGLRRAKVVCNVVHAWGIGALTAAALGTRAALPIIFSPTDYPRRRDVRWVLSVMGHRNVQVICPTDTIRRRFVERGVPIERCHLIRPGIAFAKIRRRRDPALREALGIGPDDRVMLAPGESTRATAHEDSLFAATVLNVMDRRNRLLVWGRGPRAEALRRFSDRLQRPTFVDAHAMLRRPIAFEELFSAADEVLIASIHPSVPTLPICACMAAALPIVAVVTPTIAELLEDRHTALLVGKATPRVIAQRVLDLREDPDVQWSISDMARTEAYEFFSLTRFLEQFRSAYEQLVTRNAIQIEQPAPGAGLRFHGRG